MADYRLPDIFGLGMPCHQPIGFAAIFEKNATFPGILPIFPKYLEMFGTRQYRSFPFDQKDFCGNVPGLNHAGDSAMPTGTNQLWKRAPQVDARNQVAVVTACARFTKVRLD